MKQELHILIGCADARDLNQIQIDAVAETIGQFSQSGIDIDFHVIRAAGSFITPDVFMDIKRIIEENQKESYGHYTGNDYYIHIQTHGHFTDDSDKSYIGHIYDMKIVDGSPLNCGMLNATGVGVELEQLLINNKLKIDLPEGSLIIDEDTKIRILLKEVYGYDGYLAGDWIRSIDYLRTHPRQQKSKLEKLIDQDPELKVLNIKVTAGLQDYSIHSLIRLDGGEPKTAFWDALQATIRDKVGGQDENIHSLVHQNERQQPMAGLLSLTDPKRSSRALAAQYYLKMKGHKNSDVYLPNTIFNITGSAFDVPYTPFGPYVIAGFYYSVKYLGLTDQMVLGYDRPQTGRMLSKIEKDPIMNLIVKQFNVNLIALNQVELSSHQYQFG